MEKSMPALLLRARDKFIVSFRVGAMEAMSELAHSLVGTWRWSVLADVVVAAVATGSV